MDKNVIQGVGVASGTDNYIVTLSVGVTQLVTRALYVITFTNANTAASDLDINTIGAAPIKDQSGADILAGAIDAGATLVLLYDGTNFVMQNGTGNANFASQAEVDTGTVTNKSIAPNTNAIARQANRHVSATLSGVNTKTASLTPAISAYSANQLLTFRNSSTNTGAVTININAVGAKSVVDFSGDALVGNEMIADAEVLLAYNATADNFTLLSDHSPYRIGSGSNSILLRGDSTNSADSDFSASLSGQDNDVTTGTHNAVVSGQDNTINPGTSGDSHNAILGGQDNKMEDNVQHSSILNGQGNIVAQALYTGASAETDVYGATMSGSYNVLDRPYARVMGTNGPTTVGKRMASDIIMTKGTVMANTQVFLRIVGTADAAANEGLPFSTTDDSVALMRIMTVIQIETGGSAGDTYISYDLVGVKTISGVTSILDTNNLLENEDGGPNSVINNNTYLIDASSNRMRLSYEIPDTESRTAVSYITFVEHRIV